MVATLKTLEASTLVVPWTARHPSKLHACTEVNVASLWMRSSSCCKFCQDTYHIQVSLDEILVTALRLPVGYSSTPLCQSRLPSSFVCYMLYHRTLGLEPWPSQAFRRAELHGPQAQVYRFRTGRKHGSRTSCPCLRAAQWQHPGRFAARGNGTSLYEELIGKWTVCFTIVTSILEKPGRRTKERAA